jgi:hypothetical protein
VVSKVVTPTTLSGSERKVNIYAEVLLWRSKFEAIGGALGKRTLTGYTGVEGLLLVFGATSEVISSGPSAPRKGASKGRKSKGSKRRKLGKLGTDDLGREYREGVVPLIQRVG